MSAMDIAEYNFPFQKTMQVLSKEIDDKYKEAIYKKRQKCYDELSAIMFGQRFECTFIHAYTGEIIVKPKMRIGVRFIRMIVAHLEAVEIFVPLGSKEKHVYNRIMSVIKLNRTNFKILRANRDSEIKLYAFNS